MDLYDLGQLYWDNHPDNPANEGIDDYCNDRYDEEKDNEMEVSK